MNTKRLHMWLTAAVVLTGCAESQMGTETGNPPVVSNVLLRVTEAGENKVRVIGEAGAVEPGGGEISLRNLTRDGAAVVAAVAPDGAFSATLKGTLDDTYEVVASNADGDSAPRTLRPAAEPKASTWKLLHPCGDTDPRDALQVSKVRLEGDTLRLNVAHAGGCANHEYGLCYGREWGESFPIQVGLTVLHDAHDDTCEAIENADLSFDLTPFRAAYQAAYLSDSGAASFNLEDCSDDAGCGVLYEWPRLGPVPKEWVDHKTECGFSFQGPEDLQPVEEGYIPSCRVEFESEECTFVFESGRNREGFDFLVDEKDHERFSIDVAGGEAQVHTAERPGEDPRYVLGIYAPEPEPAYFLWLYINCSTREARDALRPLVRSLSFE